MSVHELDLKEILTTSIALARQSGSIILEGSKEFLSPSEGSPRFLEEKVNSADVVTKYDRLVEDIIRTSLKASYPTFGFIGEEETSARGSLPALTDEPTFCVDPIDGTMNFVHGFPFVCVSIGLIFKKRAVLGVIYNPFLDWLYYGAKCLGSYLIKNGREPQRLPLFPPQTLPSLSQALIGVDWGCDRRSDRIRSKAESFIRLAGDPESIIGGKMAHSLRSVGSGALNIALVASGSMDMFWEIGSCTFLLN